MGYAFISYSTRNQQQADEMHRLLQGRGIDTWMAPGDIPPGSKYAQAINVAIKECSCVVLMLSEQAQESVWVAKEIERAVNYRKPVFPVQLDDVVLNDEFELYISTNQIVMMKTVNSNAPELERLFTSVEKHTGSKKIELPDATQSMLQALSDVASSMQQSVALGTEPALLNYESEDVEAVLLDNGKVYLEFCNCEVVDGNVQLSFWARNNMNEKIKLFGHEICVNGEPNSEYTFDYFGGVDAMDTDYCKMELYDVKPEGRITVSGAVEVDDNSAGKLFATQEFSVTVDFDTHEQVISIDSVSPARSMDCEFEDLSVDLIDNDQVHLEFCNCKVEDGEVKLSFWMNNMTSGRIKLFGEDIRVNGEKNNNDYVFDFFGEVSARDTGYCDMELYNAQPKGVLTVTGNIEVDHKGSQKLFRTPAFRITVDFDQMEQSITVETDAPVIAKNNRPAVGSITEYNDVPFILFDNGRVQIEVEDFVDLDGEDDLTGVGMLMNVQNNTDGLIQLYGNDVILNGRPNNELHFDYCGEVEAGDSDVCGLILSAADAEGKNQLSGRFEIDDESNDKLFDTPDFSIEVDFDKGTIRAEIFSK